MSSSPTPAFESLRLGTRRSLLARTQSGSIRDRIVALGVARAVEMVELVTLADRERDRPMAELWGTGIFSRELDEALADGRVDLAVHSLKDLPVERPAGLVLAAVPEREDPRDALVAPPGTRFRDLPAGARVGTSSPRRRLQLAAARPDLVFEEMRGNVETRIRAVRERRLDAVVLACAGLHRLGRAGEVTEQFDPGVCTPAPGQGALAVEVRAENEMLRAALAGALDSPPARAAVEAERSFLAALGGGCRVPIGALARAEGESLRLAGMIANPLTGDVWRGEVRGLLADPAAAGRALAESAPDSVRAWALAG